MQPWTLLYQVAEPDLLLSQKLLNLALNSKLIMKTVILLL